mmetsp:Transcript_51682/g.166273  ORF Transcript_51682/g.166273 Transcript_51682/m.166273 type:complete len:240 (-) Transcript_51682:92-811(-)
MTPTIHILFLLIVAGASCISEQAGTCARGSTCREDADDTLEDSAWIQIRRANKLNLTSSESCKCNNKSQTGFPGDCVGGQFGCCSKKDGKLCNPCTCNSGVQGQFGSCVGGVYGCCGSEDGLLCDKCSCNNGFPGRLGTCSNNGTFGCCGSRTWEMCANATKDPKEQYCTCKDGGFGSIGNCTDGRLGCCGEGDGSVCNKCSCLMGGQGLIGACKGGGPGGGYGCCSLATGTFCNGVMR